jgi:hypothetical protein
MQNHNSGFDSSCESVGFVSSSGLGFTTQRELEAGSEAGSSSNASVSSLRSSGARLLSLSARNFMSMSQNSVQSSLNRKSLTSRSSASIRNPRNSGYEELGSRSSFDQRKSFLLGLNGSSSSSGGRGKKRGPKRSLKATEADTLAILVMKELESMDCWGNNYLLL